MQTSDAAIHGTIATLKRPPGRKPRERDVHLPNWYNSLSEINRFQVEKALREAAELSIFSFLCILDGVRVIEDGPLKGELKLSYQKEGESVSLNDSTQEFLHDMYNYLCQKAS